MLSLGHRQEEVDGIAIIPSIPDNFIYVIPMEDDLLHTNDTPFCLDQSCPCHEDEAAIAAVDQSVQDGLLTTDEATDFVFGKLL